MRSVGSSLRPLVACFLVCLAALAVTAKAEESPFTVAKVTVDVTSKDAVAAKRIGMGKAQKQAFDILLKRFVPLSDAAQLPILEQEDIEGMVNGVSVRSEQMSSTRYIANLDVSFNEQAVRQLLATYGVAYSEIRSPSISILPVVIEGGAVKAQGAEGWRQAWTSLDLDHGMVPATILQPRPNLDAKTVKAILNDDLAAFEAMRSEYGSAPLVLAVGQIEGNKLTTRLVGTDGVGDLNLGRTDKIAGGDAKGAARNAAAISFGILENRWKVLQSGEGGGVPGEARFEQVPREQETPREPAAIPRNVVADVEFSGLQHWQEIRGRLMSVRGIQALEVNVLTARAASITFDYAGSLNHLQQELGQVGIAFEDRRDGTFVLRSR